ncbi:MAG: NAD(+)/NADH kinase, partial [Thermoplasmata archaeon]
TNEVTIHTANVGKILSLQLEVNGVVAEEIDGDGIIIASPTGSTSYALSVGGPIVDPSLKAFIVAPMAPFRHISSPLIIPADKELSVKILGRKRAEIVIDGMHSFPLSSKDLLIITRSPNTASFIRLEDNFYKKVYERLSFKGRKFKR